MTAEERLAYFQGEKRREAVVKNKRQEKNTAFIFLKIKFMITVLIFIVFLSLDYTGYRIKGIGSQEIVKMVTSHTELSDQIELPKFP